MTLVDFGIAAGVMMGMGLSIVAVFIWMHAKTKRN